MMEYEQLSAHHSTALAKGGVGSATRQHCIAESKPWLTSMQGVGNFASLTLSTVESFIPFPTLHHVIILALFETDASRCVTRP
ncbi:unnamed protein product [Hydatigera taeniaeformis]|uniref:Uncharacterized protein n=1 Tax=Hydatigena taeniaeformis TaxID=6205 RepID=A0A0R3XCY9_HYDTA|nr:unnamed protein product [Hydatigera taeniaeformis]